ncbi:alkaline phosphatase family protein [Marinomonas sp. 2405UD66-6]|uniref:alkaline phosphatase family protein n=1 Tax=Marinomonas sp. 2405UD66-6 TaxID=3391834 RepID=UPI0039C91356
MKMLVIGMDGVCLETFDRGWTPFIKSLLDKGQKLELKEDLISRGWSEIVTGKHALDTGGLYEGPTAKGGLDWTEAFKISDVPGLGKQVKPLWQVLNEKGYKVGIMNVPTTFPAPEVDGFLVSGGGGGGPISQDVSPVQCHPSALAARLRDMGYILDERRPTLLDEKGLYAPADFFARLRQKNEKRTQAFIQLSSEFEVDFGFVVYRSSTVTTETMLVSELEKLSLGRGGVNQDYIKQSEVFYRELDGNVRALVETYNEAEVLLVSDHSMVTNRYSVNANAFLIEKGYQTNDKSRRGILDIIKAYKHFVPYSLKEKLKKSKKIKNAYQSMVPFNPKKTQAFSQSFSSGQHGIYINDEVRFGGPVKSDEIKKIAEGIVRHFNAHPLALQHGLTAKIKPQSSSPVAYKFPDIILDCPDGYFTNNKFKDFIVKTDIPEEALDLRDIKKGVRTVVKGHIPLAVNVNNEWSSKDGTDLTLIYQHIVSKF